jgi:hypothetical protein
MSSVGSCWQRTAENTADQEGILHAQVNYRLCELVIAP